jgi:hypothetical protein
LAGVLGLGGLPFNVPLNEIEKAINLVIAGDIKNYRMDGATGRVVLK